MDFKSQLKKYYNKKIVIIQAGIFLHLPAVVQLMQINKKFVWMTKVLSAWMCALTLSIYLQVQIWLLSIMDFLSRSGRLVTRHEYKKDVFPIGGRRTRHAGITAGTNWTPASLKKERKSTRNLHSFVISNAIFWRWRLNLDFNFKLVFQRTPFFATSAFTEQALLYNVHLFSIVGK